MLSIHFLTSFVSFSQKSAKYSTHPHPILQPRHYHELYPSPKPINGQYYSKDAEVDIIIELCQEEFLPSQSAHKLCWIIPSRDPEFKTGASLFQTELTKLVILHLEFCCVFTCNLGLRISCNHFGLALRFGNVIWAGALSEVLDVSIFTVSQQLRPATLVWTDVNDALLWSKHSLFVSSKDITSAQHPWADSDFPFTKNY